MNIEVGKNRCRGVLHPASTRISAEHLHDCVLMVAGASGGLTGPAGIYPILARKLQRSGVHALRIDYRRPSHLALCVDDVMDAIRHLEEQLDVKRVILVGKVKSSLLLLLQFFFFFAIHPSFHPSTICYFVHLQIILPPSPKDLIQITYIHLFAKLISLLTYHTGWSFGGAVVINAGVASEKVVGVATVASQTMGCTETVKDLAPDKSLFLIHGTSDLCLSYKCSTILYARAKEPKDLMLLEGDDHCISHNCNKAEDAIYKWAMDIFTNRERRRTVDEEELNLKEKDLSGMDCPPPPAHLRHLTSFFLSTSFRRRR